MYASVSHLSKEKAADCWALLANSGILSEAEKKFYETALKGIGTCNVIEEKMSSDDEDNSGEQDHM